MHVILMWLKLLLNDRILQMWQIHIGLTEKKDHSLKCSLGGSSIL